MRQGPFICQFLDPPFVRPERGSGLSSLPRSFPSEPPARMLHRHPLDGMKCMIMVLLHVVVTHMSLCIPLAAKGRPRMCPAHDDPLVQEAPRGVERDKRRQRAKPSRAQLDGPTEEVGCELANEDIRVSK